MGKTVYSICTQQNRSDKSRSVYMLRVSHKHSLVLPFLSTTSVAEQGLRALVQGRRERKARRSMCVLERGHRACAVVRAVLSRTEHASRPGVKNNPVCVCKGLHF